MTRESATFYLWLLINQHFLKCIHNAQGYDIAILTLDKEVTTVKPVRVANIDQTPAIVEGYKNAFATGWGRTDPHSKSSSEVLLVTVLKILSNADYQKIKSTNLPDIKGTQMSAYYPFGGRGICRVIINLSAFIYIGF